MSQWLTCFRPGTLSFVTYYLLKNPNVMRKLVDEIDEVIGDEKPQYEHLSRLPYLTGMRHHASLAA